jgi:hypothetical protein
MGGAFQAVGASSGLLQGSCVRCGFTMVFACLQHYQCRSQEFTDVRSKRMTKWLRDGFRPCRLDQGMGH